MTTTFETAKVGDKVYDLDYGWCKIVSIHPNSNYPININLTECCNRTYTYDGKRFDNQLTQCLFWDEVIITPPPKPAPKLEVDTKVLVWNTENDKKQRRYFSNFSFKDNAITTFIEGKTSWTTNFIEIWKHWELAKE